MAVMLLSVRKHNLSFSVLMCFPILLLFKDIHNHTHEKSDASHIYYYSPIIDTSFSSVRALLISTICPIFLTYTRTLPSPYVPSPPILLHSLTLTFSPPLLPLLLYIIIRCPFLFTQPVLYLMHSFFFDPHYAFVP